MYLRSPIINDSWTTLGFPAIKKADHTLFGHGFWSTGLAMCLSWPQFPVTYPLGCRGWYALLLPKSGRTKCSHWVAPWTESAQLSRQVAVIFMAGSRLCVPYLPIHSTSTHSLPQTRQQSGSFTVWWFQFGPNAAFPQCYKYTCDAVASLCIPYGLPRMVCIAAAHFEMHQEYNGRPLGCVVG